MSFSFCTGFGLLVEDVISVSDWRAGFAVPEQSGGMKRSAEARKARSRLKRRGTAIYKDKIILSGLILAIYEKKTAL